MGARAQLLGQRRSRAVLSLPAVALALAAQPAWAAVGVGEPRRAWAECRHGEGRDGCAVRIGGGAGGGPSAGATAWGIYAPAGPGGWPQLEVETRSAAGAGSFPADRVSLELEAYAAGLVEGALTCKDIAAYWFNVHNATEMPSEEGMRFIKDQDDFVRSEARRHGETDDYWHGVGMVLAQFDGILSAQRAHCPSEAMTEQELLLLNLDGDLFDIVVAFRAPAVAPAPEELPAVPDGPRGGRHRPLHCSALFKVLPDHSDIFFGHDTWDTYATAAPRIFKTYTLPVRRNRKVEKHMDVFSSSPGYLSSIDDYYTIAGTAELAVTETSLDVNKISIYKELRPQTVPCWLRVMAANTLARSAEEWTTLFSRLHSGTYNNQWMVLDLRIFRASGPSRGSFWVLEEAPGKVVAADLSHRLRSDLYWASYNVAFFPEIRRAIAESGSWTHDPRARLFSELQGNATTLEGMKFVMGWNDYLHSDVSRGNPNKAIMARGDLKPGAKGNAGAFGGIDSKVSSLSLYSRGMVTVGRVGPTHDSVPPFCWSDQFASVPHREQPACFNFTWERLWPGRTEPLVWI